MEVIHTPNEARQLTFELRSGGRTLGLVPTMGALHEGHLSLVRSSVQTCNWTVATIFVNPTQFGPNEDLDKYPRMWRDDCRLLNEQGVAAVYAPKPETMYPHGFSTFIDPPEVARTLEGVHRPGHFRGVTTIVLKLFHAIPATHAFFGRKDYQQWKVIQAMTRDLDIGVQIVDCETVREPDGLAMSSRNRYLNDSQRKRALLLSKALDSVDRLAQAGQRNIEVLEQQMRQTLLGADSHSESSEAVDRIDYAVVVDAETLSPLTQLDRPAVALIAARIGNTRLIDNRLLRYGFDTSH